MHAHREARAISMENREKAVKEKNMGHRRGAEREGSQMPRAQQPEPNKANGEDIPPYLPNPRGWGRYPMKP